MGALLILTGVACGGVHGDGVDGDGLPTDPVSYAFIRERPDAGLVFPGSLTLNQAGDGERAPDQSAFVGGVYHTTAAPNDVVRWYRERLGAERWQAWDGNVLIDFQQFAEGFQRGNRERFVVGIDDPKLQQLKLRVSLPAGGTTFDILYAINSSRQPP